jgi:hypothetical protein
VQHAQEGASIQAALLPIIVVVVQAFVTVMDLPVDPTDADVVAFLARNDPAADTLPFHWHERINEWTPLQLQAVADAASRSTIRTLDVAVRNNMTDDAATKVVDIIRRFGNVSRFRIKRRMVTPQTLSGRGAVDKILLGMTQSESPVEHLYLDVGAGHHALREFMMKFRDISEICLGERRCVYLTQQFSRSLILALTETQLPKLKSLGLRITWFDHDVAPILSCASVLKIEFLRVVLEQDGEAELLLAHIGMACSSVKHLHLRWCGPGHLDLAPLFKVSSSVSLNGATFENCRLPKVEAMADSWLQSRIENFVVRGSGSDAAEIYLWSLPSLKNVSFGLTVGERYRETDPFPFVRTDGQAVALAKFLPKHPNIDHVKIELSRSPGNHTFRSIEALLKNCKGELDLTLVDLPASNVAFAYLGLMSCSQALQSVKLRFAGCGLGDEDYARFLQILASNKSLACFELNLEGTQDLEQFTSCVSGLLRASRTLKVLKLTGLPRDVAEKILHVSIPCLQDNDSLSELHVTPTAGPIVLSDELVHSLLGILREHNRVFRAFGSGVSFPGDDATAAIVQATRILMRQNRFGRRSVLDGPGEDPSTPTGLWPYLLGNVAADPGAHDVLYQFLKVKSSREKAQLCQETGCQAGRSSKRQRQA